MNPPLWQRWLQVCDGVSGVAGLLGVSGFTGLSGETADSIFHLYFTDEAELSFEFTHPESLTYLFWTILSLC